MKWLNRDYVVCSVLKKNMASRKLDLFPSRGKKAGEVPKVKFALEPFTPPNSDYAVFTHTFYPQVIPASIRRRTETCLLLFWVERSYRTTVDSYHYVWSGGHTRKGPNLSALPLAMDLQRGVREPGMAQGRILQLSCTCQHLSNTILTPPPLPNTPKLTHATTARHWHHGQGLSSEATSFSSSRDIFELYGTRNFTSAFSTACLLSSRWARRIKYTPSYTSSLLHPHNSIHGFVTPKLK
jgi:hypothetical protein